MDTSIFKYGELPEFKKFTPENISKQFPVVLEKISEDFKNIEKNLSNYLIQNDLNWDKVINPLNEVNEILRWSWGVISHLNAVDNSESLRDIYSKFLPEIISLSNKFGQSKIIYNSLVKLKETNNFDQIKNRILDKEILEMQHRGISLQKNDQESEICSIKVQIDNLQRDLNSLFVTQSTERKKIAKKLQNSVMSILGNLGVENANFSIQFSECKPSGDGIDNINFLFSANTDQKLAPLSNVISGGEMSRFLLAIKSSISKKPNSFFLDEIDNGLSGKSLFALVELIKEISKEQQVLCITHQPFLAAGGYAHFKVHKDVRDGITYTSISKLSTKRERKNELIELIGGGSSEANDYASRLLDRAAA